MAETSRTKPCTFNISFTEEEFDESRYAQLMQKNYTDHHTIQLRPESMLDELENALGAMDTPVEMALTLMWCQKPFEKKDHCCAFRHGGDELFAGYPSSRDFWTFKSEAHSLS
jgi:asparagine synthetase B (glutamine-hydrolysing)